MSPDSSVAYLGKCGIYQQKICVLVITYIILALFCNARLTRGSFEGGSISEKKYILMRNRKLLVSYRRAFCKGGPLQLKVQ